GEAPRRCRSPEGPARCAESVAGIMRRGAGLLLAGLAVLGLASRVAAQANGIPLTVLQTQHCSAFAPGDWTLTSNPQASTADANSGDRSMYAGWGGLAVNRAMQQYYGDLYGDPEASVRTIASAVVQAMGDGGGVRYSSAPQRFLNYFTLRTVESA